MNNEKLIYKLCDFYKMISDFTRMKILNELLERPLTLSTISKKINVSKIVVKNELELLINKNIVVKEKDARIISYRISNSYISKVIKTGIKEFSKYEKV